MDEQAPPIEVIIDTNVLLTAHGVADHVSPACIKACSEFLDDITNCGMLVIDAQWQIIKEYMHKINLQGPNTPGKSFLNWVLKNRTTAKNIRQISITPQGKPNNNGEYREFAEFPDDPALVQFDRSDRKFVAVAIADPAHPPIHNATDTRSWGKPEFAEILAKHGISIIQLCPDMNKTSV